MTNNTAKYNQPIATSENTAFVTIAAYKDYETVTAAFRQSAENNGVPITLYDTDIAWQNFYVNKIERLYEHLTRLRGTGTEFVFFLDSRDVVFIDPLDVILTKFNAINDGRMIFNQDALGKIWPSHNDSLALAIEEATESKYTRLNAGMYAGGLETILKIQKLAIEMRQELKNESPRSGILETLHREIGARHCDDDQHLYQICLSYHPELIRIDSDKELFAVMRGYPKNLRECSDDPERFDVINNAAIVHSPWMSSCQEWDDWAFQKRWER